MNYSFYEQRNLHLIKLLDLQRKKLERVEYALVLENNPSIKFALEQQLTEILESIKQLQDEIEELQRKMGDEILHGEGQKHVEEECDPPLEIETLLHMQAIPTGYYHLLEAEENPLVSYVIKNHTDKDQEVGISTRIRRYSDPWVEQCTCHAGSKIELHHLPTLIPSKIAQLNEVRKATLETLVIRPGEITAFKKESHSILMHARNTALLAIYDPILSEWKDYTRYIAAWVTPNSESVQVFLNKVRTHHPDGILVGYQGGNTKQQRIGIVRKQVQAIYEAIKDSGLGYINSNINFGQQSNEMLQRVRLPSESLKGLGANCIDGTVLFASLIQAVSLEPMLVFIPGHAFVGWKIWSNLDEFEFLDTTLVAYESFEKALKVGLSLFELNKKNLGNSIFHSSGFMIMISITDARQQNIFPFE